VDESLVDMDASLAALSLLLAFSLSMSVGRVSRGLTWDAKHQLGVMSGVKSHRVHKDLLKRHPSGSPAKDRDTRHRGEGVVKSCDLNNFCQRWDFH
jgi:hypothetical protein